MLGQVNEAAHFILPSPATMFFKSFFRIGDRNPGVLIRSKFAFGGSFMDLSTDPYAKEA